MFDRRELLLFTAASAAAASHGSAAAPKAGRKQFRNSRASEIGALRLFAETTHPRGREARDDREWQSRWNSLERSANSLSDGAYFVGARRALAWFEDGHSTVLPFEFIGKIPPAFATGPFSLHLPWKVKLFDDGAYVVGSDNAGRAGLGRRVARVGKFSISELIRRFDDSWAGNRAWAHHWAGIAMASPAQLQGLGAINDSRAPFTVGFDGGGPELNLRPTTDSSAASVSVERTKTQGELWAAELKRGNYVRLLTDKRALYISIDEMADVEGQTFKQLTTEAFAAMDGAPADRLVIDLRRNGGGDNFLGEALRKRIERSRFNRRGGLYVLTGPATFSAAQNLANRIERETFALFVSGPTGLSPNHYGDAKIFTGPVTGLTAMVSTLPWFDSYPQDKRQWIMPDLPVRETFADWQSGRDPALELALAHRSDGTANEWSSDSVFYYSRASQKADWKPFWA